MLEDAFSEALAHGRNFIFVFDCVAVAIHFDGLRFFIFDSHSRNENGMICPDGKCVLGNVESLVDLCTFLRSLANSLGLCLANTQYDLHTMNFSKRYRPTPFEVKILDRVQGFKIRTIKRRGSYSKSSNPTKKQKPFNLGEIIAELCG